MNFLDEDKVDHIGRLVAAGKSIRQIMATVGAAKETVAGYRREWLAAGNELPLCKCGKRSDHKGWCAHRYAGRPARQETMRQMQLRQWSGAP